MNQEAVCIVSYLRLTEEMMAGKELHEYQKKLAFDMLKQVFSDFLYTELREEDIKRTKLGKPYYAKDNGCCFNISHCKTAVVVAVSKYPVGIDVESMRQVKYIMVRKCCSPKELQYVMNTKDSQKEKTAALSEEETKRFLHMWTLKESYVKMTGEGLRMPIDTICYNPEKFLKKKDILLCKKELELNSSSYLYFPENLIIALTIQKKTLLTEKQIIWKEYVRKEIV